MLRTKIRQTGGITVDKMLSSNHIFNKMKRKKYFAALALVSAAAVVLFRHFQNFNVIVEDEDIGDLPLWWSLSPLWSEDGLPHVNPHPYRFLNNNPDICRKEIRTDILILVSSAVEHTEQRESIRSTWGSRSSLDPYNGRIGFLLGQGRDRQSDVNEEAALYGDIIQEDFHDIYHNLTLKTIMGLKWSAIFCQEAKFVMKTDDDIFVNVPLLHQALFGEYDSYNKIIGCIKNGAGAPQPIPSGNSVGQQAVVFRPGHPEFVAGAGYVIPGHYSSELYLASLSTKFIPVEDAYATGYCATKLGIHPPHHDNRFSCGQIVSDDCDMKKMFTGHKVTPERQYAIYEKIHQTYNACGSRTET